MWRLEATMPVMEKKRKRPLTTPPDQHKSGFMVRLPEVYRTQLRELKKRNRRPLTVEVQIALEEYLAKHDLWPVEGN